MRGSSGIPGVATALVVALLVPLSVGAARRQAPGTFERHSFSNQSGTLEYMLYVPPNPRPRRPLVVYIPGAAQTAEQAAHDTAFNRLAARRNIFVLYPEAPLEEGAQFGYNREEDRHRGTGDASLIAGVTRAVVRDWKIDRRRVFVGGSSNGGAMANVMVASYPDVYAAFFSHSGGPYTCDGGALIGCLKSAEGSSRDIRSEMGRWLRSMPFIVFHGSNDFVVPQKESEAIVGAWLIVADVADDGADNGSVSRRPAWIRRATVPDGLAYTVSYYRDGRGCPLGEYWLVEGMRHAYSGGPPNTPQGIAIDTNSERKFSAAGTDPAGPDASSAVYRFFMAHPMGWHTGVRACR